MSDIDLSFGLRAFREAIPVTASRAYLFSGGIAPAARPVIDAMASWIDLWASDPIHHRSHYGDDLERSRSLLARLLHAPPDGFAITGSTSRASNLAASFVSASPGDNVVVDATTYPSSLFPWLLPGRPGTVVRHVSASPEAGWEQWEASVDSRTRAIMVSHVDPDTGYRHDLERLSRLAHSHGAMLVVDGAQSAGAIDIDIDAQGVDMFAGVSMKWLMGPPGLGFLYVRPEILERVPMHEASYTSATIAPTGGLAYATGARRLEHGVQDLPGLAGFAAGLELVLETGIRDIEAHIATLVSACVAGLEARGWTVVTPSDERRRAGILVLDAPDPGGLTAWLREAGVDIWGYPERRRVRIDPHGFNDISDIDRLLTALDAYGSVEDPERRRTGA